MTPPSTMTTAEYIDLCERTTRIETKLDTKLDAYTELRATVDTMRPRSDEASSKFIVAEARLAEAERDIVEMKESTRWRDRTTFILVLGFLINIAQSYYAA